MVRMLWRSFLLWLTSYVPDDGEAHISDLAVAQDFQARAWARCCSRQAELWAIRRTAGPP